MRISKALAGTAALAAMACGVLGSAAPAFASEGDGVMQGGEFIVWRDCHYTGPIYDYASVHDRYSEFFINDVTPVDEHVSSVRNMSTVNSVNAFLNVNLTGPKMVVLPGKNFDLCSEVPAFNEGISSHSF